MEVADAQPSPAGDVQVICESGPQPAPGAPERAASVALSAADQQSAASAALAPHPAASATLGPAPSEAAATCPPPAATALLVGRVRRTLVDVAAEARGKVSPVWQFFEKFDKPVNTKGSNTRCKIANGEEDGAVCGRLYKHTAGNGTSSLIDHLAKEHQEEHKKVMGASAHSKETRALKGAAFASAGKSPFSAKAKETTPQLKARLDRKSVIWCVRNGRPWHALHDAGLKLILAEFVPDYAASSTSHGVLDKILSSMYDDAKASLVKTLEQVHTDLKERGYNGPFCSLQLDLTSVASNEFCTASVSVVEPGGEETPLHLNLATKVFSGTHKQADVKRWIEQLTSGIFASFIPGVKPKDVYIAATVDQGLNVVNACKALGLETLLCLCHRINSLVLWAVGISGSAATCQNPPGRALVGAGALTVGVFSHSCCNTDAFRKVQEELIVEDQEEMEEFRINAVTIEDAMPEKSQDGLPQALNFIRRNDTRWTSLFRFVERLCILEEPVSKFLQDRGDMAHRGLSPGQWMALKELCSLLEPLKIVTVKIQGGVDGILSRAIHLCHDLGAMLGENEVETIDWASRRRRAGATEGPMRDTVDLTEVSQTFLKVACDQIEKRKIGTPEADVELLALWLDPRFKNLGPNDCGGVECRDKARKALDRVKERMVEALPAEQSGSSSSTNPPPAKRLAVAKNAYERRQQRRRETDAASVQALLIGKGGGVDVLTANKIEDTWTLALEQVMARISKDFSPEADFEARRMTKEDFPGRYPYRDSGLMYWEATHTWVKGYLDIYYENDGTIAGDYELQAFVYELIHIGQMKWLDEFGGSRNKKSLIAKVLASLIYSASTLHAAVNFPQKSRTSFVPNTPGAVFAAPPTDKEERTFEDYLAYLPPIETATTQVALTTLLGSVYHTKLGDYETHHFSDKCVREPLAKFQQAIEDIETHMVDENAYVVASWRQRGKDKREAANFGYTTLLPDNIPQSINI